VTSTPPPTPNAYGPANDAAIRAEARRVMLATPALRRGRLKLIIPGIVYLAAAVIALPLIIVGIWTPSLLGVFVAVAVGGMVAGLLLLFWGLARELGQQRELATLVGAGHPPEAVAELASLRHSRSMLLPLLLSVVLFVVTGAPLLWFFSLLAQP
jgi:hypothetical protein